MNLVDSLLGVAIIIFLLNNLLLNISTLLELDLNLKNTYEIMIERDESFYEEQGIYHD